CRPCGRLDRRRRRLRLRPVGIADESAAGSVSSVSLGEGVFGRVALAVALEEALDGLEDLARVSLRRDGIAEADVDRMSLAAVLAAETRRPELARRHRRARAGDADRDDLQLVAGRQDRRASAQLPLAAVA